MTKQIDENRLYWIDAIRSFACLCVITTHAPIPGGTNGLYMITPFNYFAVAGASILFFMISGALVLYKPKPVTPFLKKRLSRIVFPMVFWTIISLLIMVQAHEIGWSQFWHRVCMIPFGPQEGTYWFIYVIFGIYLLTPIFATWLEKCSQNDLKFYLSVWGVTLLLPYLGLLNKEFEVLVEFRQGYLYDFYGFMWFAVMGYYVRRYVNIKKYNNWHYVLFAFLVILPALLYLTPIPHSVIQDRLSLNLVALCVCYFVVLKHFNLSERMKRICYNFAQHSFGIYLVHIIVMRRLLWPLIAPLDLHYAIQIPLVVAFTALISYTVIHLISKLPYSKYIVGL